MADIVQLVENGVKKYMKSHAKAIDGLYAVGDVVFSTKSDNPSVRFGGTWQRFGEGQFIVGASDTDVDFAAGKTGGEKTVSLTEKQLPAHKHTTSDDTKFATIAKNTDPAGFGLMKNPALGIGTSTGTSNTGGNEAHNNLPPYIALYMWVKTA